MARQDPDIQNPDDRSLNENDPMRERKGGDRNPDRADDRGIASDDDDTFEEEDDELDDEEVDEDEDDGR
jgi:hypothetical protein